MVEITFIFIAFILFLQYLSYKKLQNFEKKIENSIKKLTDFSLILEDIYRLSTNCDVDFKSKIFNLLLDFSDTLLHPNFMILYTFNQKINKFSIFGYRIMNKEQKDFVLEMQAKKESFFKEFLSKANLEIFLKDENLNKEKFPLIHYFDSSLIIIPIRIEGDVQAVFVSISSYFLS